LKGTVEIQDQVEGLQYASNTFQCIDMNRIAIFGAIKLEKSKTSLIIILKYLRLVLRGLYGINGASSTAGYI
jgi:hypothetical protein